MTEQIIIEFVSDPSGLQPTEDKLAALGKVDQQAANVFKQTNTELKKRETLITSNTAEATKLKTSYDGLRNAVLKESQVMKLSAEEFKRTGKTLEQLVNEMKGATAETKKNTTETEKAATATKTLRTELRSIVEQLTKLKLEGKDNTEQFRQLTAQAARLQDAMGKVSQRVQAVASDTRVFDGLIDAASGVAGAFSAAQGAAALFGDNSEELQETLLRVQSSLAILNGLQQIQKVLLKDSAAMIFLNTIATKAQTVAQTVFNFVVGTSTGLLKAFRIALAATGVGLLIIGLAKLVEMLDLFSGSAKDSEKAVAALSEELDNLKESFEGVDRAIQDAAAIDIKNLELAGASRTKVHKRTIQEIKERIAASEKEGDSFLEQRKKIDKQFDDGILKYKDWLAKREEVDEADKDAANNLQRLYQELTESKIEGQIIEREENKETNDKAIEDLKKRREKEKEARLASLEDIKAGIQLQLLEVAKGSREEIELKKQLLKAELNIALENDKLGINQRKVLNKQLILDRIQLEKDFSAEAKKISLENLQSSLNAELQEIDISNQKKVDLTIQYLEVQRQLELAAVTGNKQKEKEINAKFDREISEQSIAIRKQGLDEELRLITAQAGARQRAASRQAGDPNADLQTRINAINELLEFEIQAINKRKDLNDSLFKDGLLSAKEFTATGAELIDQEAKATEDAEQRKRDAINQTNAIRQESNRILTQKIVDGVAISIDTLSALYDFQSQKENAHIELQKQRINELRESGAISEKEAKERLKRIEIEERRNKQEQAIRNKRIEVFNSLLAIPAAYLKGLKDGGLPLALFYAGLAGLQAGLIAAKPIPKFVKGKKNQYEGLGLIGESGAEIHETKGKRYLVDKPRIVWLAATDKVYNPQETINMINKPLPHVDKRIMNFSSNNSSHTAIDYKKLGEAVGKSIPSHVVTIDDKGVTHIVNHNNSYTEYLDKRRRF